MSKEVVVIAMNDLLFLVTVCVWQSCAVHRASTVSIVVSVVVSL